MWRAAVILSRLARDYDRATEKAWSLCGDDLVVHVLILLFTLAGDFCGRVSGLGSVDSSLRTRGGGGQRPTEKFDCFSLFLFVASSIGACGICRRNTNFVLMEWRNWFPERHKLEELLKIRGLERGSYPPFSVSFRGPKVAIKFKVHPQCDVSRLIVDIVSHLG
ncbi:hypothetical protein HPP92_018027 [Vanilla planifolia]|uniref:Uncharacterized protein n=1 Tax=Vanilla planifolia TaxID=51239 RepID=A0A835ULW1_VANPL|nr:hypothetical protein HPP92_018027 [Vanilla planifolia]